MELRESKINFLGDSITFGHGDAPLGTMNDRTPDTFYGALHTLYTVLLEKYTEIPIIVITPLHRINEDNPRGCRILFVAGFGFV